MDPYFHLFIRLLSAFFSFFCQDANKTRSNRAIIGYNLSKRHKLTLCKTQGREQNYVDYKFELATWCIIPSSRNLSVPKKSSVSGCRKYRYKGICINTQLNTFYGYSATNPITNLSNKKLFFTWEITLLYFFI